MAVGRIRRAVTAACSRQNLAAPGIGRTVLTRESSSWRVCCLAKVHPRLPPGGVVTLAVLVLFCAGCSESFTVCPGLAALPLVQSRAATPSHQPEWSRARCHVPEEPVRKQAPQAWAEHATPARRALMDPSMTETVPTAEAARAAADELFAQAVEVYEGLVDWPTSGANSAAYDEQLVKGLATLQQVFSLDFEAMVARQLEEVGERTVVNVTCLKPRAGLEWGDSGETGAFITNDALLATPLEPGRLCEDGACCDTCSRTTLAALATPAECSRLMSGAASLLPSAENPADVAGKAGARNGGDAYQWFLRHNLELKRTAVCDSLRLHLLEL